MILWLACAPPLVVPDVPDNPHQDWDRDGVTEAEGDCDDEDRERRPGRGESCDGKDNDCDGEVDEDDALDATTWYQDLDGDGYGFGERAACTAPAGFVAEGGDCQDQDAAIHPGAEEVCNGVDDDCDGAADGGSADATTWYRDADGDGFGDEGDQAEACEAAPGYIAVGGDCDDTSAEAWPGHSEVCGDGLDNDCNGFASDPCPAGRLAEAEWIHGEAGGDHAGSGLAAAGDLDGDGLDDLLVGATEHDTSEALNGGAAYLLLGPVSPGTLLEDAALTWSGSHKNAELGTSLLAGDGWVAIGAPGADVDDQDRAGQVGLYAWPGGGHQLEVLGPHETARLGAALALLDGTTLAIGVERAQVGAMAPGAVVLVDVDASGSFAAEDLETLTGVGGGSYLGSAMASGDADGDGVDDLLVGAWGRSTYGSAYLLAGPLSAGPITAGQELQGSDGSDFGAAVLLADLDGDGLDEPIVGAPGLGEVQVGEARLEGGEGFGQALDSASIGGERVLLVGGEGAAWVGPVSGVVAFEWAEGGSLGERVVGLGDLDGDGHEELGFGAPSLGVAEEGAVLLVRGAEEGLPW